MILKFLTLFRPTSNVFYKLSNDRGLGLLWPTVHILHNISPLGKPTLQLQVDQQIVNVVILYFLIIQLHGFQFSKNLCLPLYLPPEYKGKAQEI